MQNIHRYNCLDAYQFDFHHCVGAIFSANNVASQRSESTNSQIKERGKKKSELRSFTLLQLMQHVVNIFNRYLEKCKKEIIALIQKARKWSDYVEAIWKQNYVAANQICFIRPADEDGVFLASASCEMPQNTIVHRVAVCDIQYGGAPSCDCNSFLSVLIPCDGICAVFGRLPNSLFVAENLVPRWRLESHPIYERALEQLGLRNASENHSNVDGVSSSNISFEEFTRHAYDSITFPNRSDVRYNRLSEAWNRIAPLAQNNEHSYKMLLLDLMAFERTMLDGISNRHSVGKTAVSENSNTLRVVPLPPIKRRSAGQHSDVNR